MRLGLSCYDISAAELVDLGQAADKAGFDTLWLGEHVVLPLDYASTHPATGTTAQQHEARPIVDPATVLVDPLVALAVVAASTSRLRVATGIYVLPLRHPLAVARVVATLHDVARGRFLFGVGAGWLREEFEALGAPFATRGERFDEALTVLRAAWAGGPFAGAGPHFPFGRVQISDQPTPVPLVLGGNSERALRRAVTRADGWFSSGTPAYDEACRLRDRIEALRGELGRTDPLPLWFRMPGCDPADLARYRGAGIEQVVVWAHELWPRDATPDDRRNRFLTAAADLGVSAMGATP